MTVNNKQGLDQPVVVMTNNVHGGDEREHYPQV